MVFVFLVLVINYTVFAQTVTIDAAVSNAAGEISEGVPQGTKIAILNISSDYPGLSDYIINELIDSLVKKRLFQIVPRNAVELEAANVEFGFQMTGFVSDESQKRLGQFLGAGTIITGTVTRNSGNSYRLVINAIDLESFTYQATYRGSIQNNGQMKTLVGSGGGNYYEDYTTGERIGMGALNMFFGIGSIMQGQKLGWGVTGAEALGVIFLAVGLGIDPMNWHGSTVDFGNSYNTPTYNGKTGQEVYDDNMRTKNGLITAGAIVAGGAIIFGYIIPFFHNKPNQTIS
jgi:TolB-like protein